MPYDQNSKITSKKLNTSIQKRPYYIWIVTGSAPLKVVRVNWLNANNIKLLGPLAEARSQK